MLGHRHRVLQGSHRLHLLVWRQRVGRLITFHLILDLTFLEGALHVLVDRLVRFLGEPSLPELRLERALLQFALHLQLSQTFVFLKFLLVLFIKLIVVFRTIVTVNHLPGVLIQIGVEGAVLELVLELDLFQGRRVLLLRG